MRHRSRSDCARKVLIRGVCGLVLLLAAPASALATEQLADGGFEGASCSQSYSGTTKCSSAIWSQAESYQSAQSYDPPTPICTTAFSDCTSVGHVARNGTHWLREGGQCTAYAGSFSDSASVSQVLIVPRGTATLSFYVRFNDDLGTSQLKVSFDGTSVYLSTGLTSAYQPVTVPVSAYADGASHTFAISFTATGTTSGAGCTDTWEVDDISLDVTPPPPDADGDGIPDSSDACPNQSDAAAQRNPRTGCPAAADADGDGVPDGTDQCPLQAGPAPGGCPPQQATNRNDILSGNAGPNVICGLLGNDILNGLGGNDTLWGDACNDKFKPVSGAAATTDGNDTLNGGDGNDRLYGAGGSDTLNGGTGNDKLYGGGGNDKLNGGPGTNTYSGVAGNDTINARNGKKETVDCGRGKKDKATVDKHDKTKGCEKVKRAKK